MGFTNANGNSHGYTLNTHTEKFSLRRSSAGAISSTATAIDNAGDIAGFFTDSGTHGFEDVGGTFTTLNDPGSMV